jgi:hypothetical protein
MAESENQRWISPWAWRLFYRWSGLDLDPRSLTAGERWSVASTVVPAVFRSRYLRPARQWMLARTPTWIVTQRLDRRMHGWYRIPCPASAEHVRLRFDMWPIEVGDHVRVQDGRLAAVGYATPTYSEIILLNPDGELEDQPKIPEMARAWAAYWAALG